MKRYLTNNVATMLMALFLALLTWVYLFTQGNGPADIQVQFQPRIDMQDLSSVTWKDVQGHELVPGGALDVRVVGPKSDVRTLQLRPKVFACEVRIDPKDVAGPQGTLRRALIREDFNLPYNIVVDPLPHITIEYAKYREKEVTLVADRTSYEGSVVSGYEIEAIIPTPRRIKARVPADQPGMERVLIRKVPVEGRVESFTLPAWFLDPAATALKVQPLEPFTVEVRLVVKPESKKFPADLNVSARPEHLKRIELETRNITLEIRGPQDLVEEAYQRQSVFVPFVVVSDKDMEPAGPKNISELGCHIVDPKFVGKLSVILMPDEKPENRQAKIKVLPK